MRAAVGCMPLCFRAIFYQHWRGGYLAGLSSPGRELHDDLKSARSGKLARKSGCKKSSRVYGQCSAEEMQLEVDSRVRRLEYEAESCNFNNIDGAGEKVFVSR